MEHEKLGKKMLRFPYILVVAVVYLGVGLFFDWWHPAWAIFLTIPFYYAYGYYLLHDSIKRLKPIILVTAICTFIFFGAGLILDAWHPAWFVFIVGGLALYMLLLKEDDEEETPVEETVTPQAEFVDGGLEVTTTEVKVATDETKESTEEVKIEVKEENEKVAKVDDNVEETKA
jgi:hypothetical protein